MSRYIVIYNVMVGDEMRVVIDEFYDIRDALMHKDMVGGVIVFNKDELIEKLRRL